MSPDIPAESETVLHTAAEIVHGPAPTLRDVRFYSISAEILEDKLDENTPWISTTGDSAEEIDMSIALRTMQRDATLGVRVLFTASQETWRVHLDIAAEYVAEAPFQVSEQGRTDFADKVGIMALFPYIREAVGNMTQRTIGTSFILPTLIQGQVSFSTLQFEEDTHPEMNSEK